MRSHKPVSRLQLFLTFPCTNSRILIVVTLASLKKQLDEDDRRESRQGRSPPHTMTASVFIMNALQIEEQQYVLHSMALMPTHPFPLDKTYD